MRYRRLSKTDCFSELSFSAYAHVYGHDPCAMHLKTTMLVVIIMSLHEWSH